MENKQTLIGEVTADQINAWKEQHGEVFAIKVNGHVCYLRKPTRRELSFATTAGKNDPLKFNETLLRGCWLGGSEAIRRDDDKFMGASGVLDKIVPLSLIHIYLETINDKGYITFRTFVGKAGYFITDDNLATTPEDDYRALTNRRVIDKAYRIAYAQLVEWLNDEVPVSKSGTLVPAWCSTVEADVEQAIETQMTAQGNLGNDPSDSSDTGVECKIDYDQNILATSQVKIGLRVKPNGYAKYIDVELGFKTA